MPREEVKRNDITWIHVRKPTGDDFSRLRELHEFHPSVMEYLVSPTLHPTLESYGDHLFLILHFPLIYRTEKENVVLEVDFLLTKKLLVTITYRDNPQLQEFFNACKDNPEMQQHFRGSSTHLSHSILDKLLSSLYADLDYIEEGITRIENKIFSVRERQLVETISHLRRDILDFRRVILTQENVLAQLPHVAQQLFGNSSGTPFKDTIIAHANIKHLIDTHKETIEALHETNHSLLQTHISNIITVLTVFSAVILPLNFVASIWGMNHRVMPFRDGPADFWIISGAMAGIAVALLYFFRKMRWL